MHTLTHAHKHNTHTYKSIAEMEGGSIMNSQFGGGSFGTSSSGMRGTGAVDFSTVYHIIVMMHYNTLYKTYYSSYIQIVAMNPKRGLRYS